MNRQGVIVNGKVCGGIDWLKSVQPNGTETPGFSCNILAGCKHGCQWRMADGKIVDCYAKTIAEGLAKKAYPYGFEHLYWHPERLDEPFSVKVPSKIFLDSQSDFAAAGVERWQQNTILDVVRFANWHTFISLTKNPKGYLGLDFPENMWVGFSTPADFMFGHELTVRQKTRKLQVDLETMQQIKASVVWGSFEPLSWDVAPYMENCQLDWAVIGAASDGPNKHQPNHEHLENLLKVLGDQAIPIFLKDNLHYEPRREEFPIIK